MSNLEIVFYMLINLFRIIVLARFINVFVEKCKAWYVSFLLYGMFYIINSFGYILFDNAMVNRITNISGLFIVSLICYKGMIIKKVFAIAVAYGSAFLTENVAWILFVKDKSERALEFGFFIAVFLFFIAELLIEKTVQIKQSTDMTKWSQLLIVIIPCGSMYISNMLIDTSNASIPTLTFALGMFVILNLAMVYIYEKSLTVQAHQYMESMYLLQIEMYKKQLEILYKSADLYKEFRHDMQHHMNMLRGYLQNNRLEKIEDYLTSMNSYLENGKSSIQTGNEDVDCIVNYYSQVIEGFDGTIQTETAIASNLKMDSFDINIILSNLFENACDAIKHCEEKKVYFYMKYDRGILRIAMKNTFDGIINVKDGFLVTSKTDKENHGLGVQSIKMTIEKYGGEIDWNTNENMFEISIILYV